MKLYEDTLYIESVLNHNFTRDDKIEYNRILTESPNKFTSMTSGMVYEIINSIKAIMDKVNFDINIEACKGDIDKWSGIKNCKTIINKFRNINIFSDICDDISEVINNLSVHKKFWTKITTIGNKTFSFIFNSIASLISMVTANMVVVHIENMAKYGADYMTKKIPDNKQFKELLPIRMLKQVKDTIKKLEYDKIKNKLKSNKSTNNKKIAEAVGDLYNTQGFDFQYKRDKLNEAIRNNNVEPVSESLLASVSVGVGLILVVVSLLTLSRNIIFMIYHKRNRCAKYLELQAEYLEAHEIELKANKELNVEKRKSIISTQRKWRDLLLKVADAIKVDDIQASNEAKKMIKNADSELTLTNIRKNELSAQPIVKQTTDVDNSDNVLELL